MSFLAAAIIAYSFVALTLAGTAPAASFSPVDDGSFSRVFFQSRWIIVGSIAAFLLAQLIDTFVVGFIGLHLPYRLGGQGVDFDTYVNSAASGYLFKFAIALSTTPALYVVHRIVDGYLGKTEAEKLIEAVAETEHGRASS
jgi:queuosine precursor transporter